MDTQKRASASSIVQTKHANSTRSCTNNWKKAANFVARRCSTITHVSQRLNTFSKVQHAVLSITIIIITISWIKPHPNLANFQSLITTVFFDVKMILNLFLFPNGILFRVIGPDLGLTAFSLHYLLPKFGSNLCGTIVFKDDAYLALLSHLCWTA